MPLKNKTEVFETGALVKAEYVFGFLEVGRLPCESHVAELALLLSCWLKAL